MFKDRLDAGRQLGEMLAQVLPPNEKGTVLALPRGGVIVGYEAAQILNWPLDIIVTRKIGATGNSEYAIAAVSEHQKVISDKKYVDWEYIKNEIRNERREIQRRLVKYRGKKEHPQLKNKTIILVDDGIATGLTAMAAIEEIKSYHPKEIILAAPVAPPDTIEKLKLYTNKIYILKIEPLFWAVGQFYENFPQINDDEVVNILKLTEKVCGV